MLLILFLFSGDSAGGNLLVAATLKCIQIGLPLPSGLFLAYTPFLLQFVPSPSRLLCLTDPLLPFGFMMKCLQSYAATNKKENLVLNNIQSKSLLYSLWTTASDMIGFFFAKQRGGKEGIVNHKGTWLSDHSPSEEFQEFDVPADPYISPYLAHADDLSRFPKTVLVSSESDPCLDDTVMFGKRLKEQNVPIDLVIFDDLPHGFLNFGASPEANEAIRVCGDKIRDLCNSK